MAGVPYASSLAELESRVKKDLGLIMEYPQKQWLQAKRTAQNDELIDVLIVGGGQGAITIAHELKRQRVVNVVMIDDNKDGQEGPWSTFARMPTLRTPKNVTGPDLGVPSLTYRAWFESQFGTAEWDALHYVSATSWHKYVNWLRDLLELKAIHETKCTKIEFVDQSEQEPTRHYKVSVTRGGHDETMYARKVVLATGIDGCGEWHVPKFINDAIPKRFWAHTREMIDFDALKGKRVGVLGAGASAFDNASVALETGVGDISLFYRRESLPDVNVYKWMGFPGFHGHHFDLPDDMRWEFMHTVLDRGQLPPTDTYNRATRHENFHLHGGSPWESVAVSPDGSEVIVKTPKGNFAFDFLIIATGFTTNLALRPELQQFVDDILLWREAYTPPAGLECGDLGNHPYLAENFRFTSRATRSVTPALEGLFCFTFGGFASNGVSGASISALKWSVPNVVHGIMRTLYQDDSREHLSTLKSFDLKEY